MARGLGAVCLLSFLATVGVTLIVLACALDEYHSWYPMFVLMTYVFAPIPSCLASRRDGGDTWTTNSVGTDVAQFATAALVLSGFGIPFVLWHAGVILGGAAWLTVSGNVIIFCTIALYFKLYASPDDEW